MFVHKLNLLSKDTSCVFVFAKCFCSALNVPASLSTAFNLSLDDARKYIHQHKLHKKLDEEVLASLDFCQKAGFKSLDIKSHPVLLKTKAMVLDQHYLVFKEGGFESVNANILAHFRKISHMNINDLISIKLLSNNVNVAESFISHLTPKPDSLRTDDLENKCAWSHIHLQIMKRYLMWRLDATVEEIERLFRVYKMIKNKSLSYLCENIKIAEDLGFTPRKLLKFGYLLHNYPKYTKTVLNDMPYLAGSDLRKAMRAYPKLVMISPHNYIKIYDILKAQNIPDETIQKSMNVFQLSPETVRSRLEELNSVPEFRIHLSNPNILSLIVHHNRARSRLNFMQQVRLKCASLHILRTDDKNVFDTHLQSGRDINNSNDLYKLLKTLLNTDGVKIETNIRKHPFYLQVPLPQIEETYKYLRGLKFRNEAIHSAPQCLLYPISKIDVALSKIRDDRDIATSRMSGTQKLNLMLYFMEQEHHFTGNGVWLSNPETS